MLRSLRIRNLAVIEAAELAFAPGFNVLTGETGAGKSILIEAVGLLLGARGPALVGELHELGDVAAAGRVEFPGGEEELAGTPPVEGVEIRRRRRDPTNE